MVTELFEKVRAEAERALSAERFAHSVRVAETAAEICRGHGIPEGLGLLAGIGHDICKEIPLDEMRRLALSDGRGETALESARPSLMHGRAAAARLRRDFGVSDADVLDAVSFHTFGAVGLCDLGKVIFVADKVEPGRPQSTDGYRARLFALPLAEMALSVLEESIAYLASRGKAAAPESAAWAESLRKSLGREK